MTTLEKDFRFEAAHRLPLHNGKCRRLHGHSWKGKLILRGSDIIQTGAKTGMVIDYSDVGAAILPLIESKLDHWYLNETLSPLYPTSENIARWIYEQVKPVLPLLIAVEIQETCTARCRYEP